MNIESEGGKLDISLSEVVVPVFTIDESTKAALASGQELTEEQASNVVTIFEAAVNSKVKEYAESLVAKHEEALEAEVGEIQEALEEQISGYLNDVVVQEWMEKNEVAIDANIVAEHNAAIVESLVGVLKENLVEIPEGRRDLLAELGEENSQLSEEVSGLEDKNKKLASQINGMKCEAVFKELSNGLTESEAEKFEGLVADLEIDDVSIFESKATLIKETFFKKGSVAPETTESKGLAGKELTESVTTPATNKVTDHAAAARLGATRLLKSV